MAHKSSGTLVFRQATLEDIGRIVNLRNEASERLTSVYGKGHWTGAASEAGLLNTMRTATVYVALYGESLVATLALSTRKPWAIDTAYFAKCKKPIYLTAMAVAPDEQLKGMGRFCVERAISAARDWRADAIRLDAYDAPAGAGEFYAKCGFSETGRAVYRDVPLTYFEFLL
jgi:GNAT superfamily N-acetyltransferase